MRPTKKYDPSKDSLRVKNLPQSADLTFFLLIFCDIIGCASN